MTMRLPGNFSQALLIFTNSLHLLYDEKEHAG
jgi:hypothetical protein